MKFSGKRLYLLLFCLTLFTILMTGPAVGAAETRQPTPSNNLSVSLRKRSSLTVTKNGYMRVFYDGTTTYNGSKILIEYYDRQFNLQSSRSLSMELPYWGGFFAGKDAYYLVEGQANKEESDTAEVIRVIKYDTNWKRLGAARITGNADIFGGQVRYPFDYGTVEFTERGDKLYIVTAHEGYVDEQYGQGHQGFLMLQIDTPSMTGSIIKSDLWHSFAQYIDSSDTDFYVLEQSEGSRYTKLTKYDAGTLNSKGSISVLDYGGTRTSAWAISCYASVDGVATSSDHVLGVGTSIDQTKYDSATTDTPHNIYLTVTPMNNFTKEATQVKWLTNYTGGGKSFLGVKLTKVNSNRFMVSWEEADSETAGDADDGLSTSTLHYLFVNGKGELLSKEYTGKMPVSECQPVVNGSQIVYYASDSSTLNFYSIDANTGAASKKTHRSAGVNASWSISGDVLTISGSGSVALTVDNVTRHPISSTANLFWSDNSDTPWSSAIRSQVRKLVISEGITSISENAFSGFEALETIALPKTLTSIPKRAFASCASLKEVTIPSGVKSIGEEAFYNCDKLTKISIPSSVTDIGADILWTGSYWIGSESHVTYAEIYTTYQSPAHKYAEKNDISYRIDLDAAGAKITGLASEYAFTGRDVCPEVSVKIGNTTLPSTEYSVSYSNNTKRGTATVTVDGDWSYYGTLTATFKIVTPDANGSLTPEDSHVTIGGIIYKITNSASQKRSAAVIGVISRKKKSYMIPASVMIGGQNYKVTAIDSKAFAGCKKARKIKLPKTVTKIGSKAFKGTSAKLKVSVPRSKYRKLSKKIRKAGLNKKAKVVKY
ncbi:MAG: leucine-rich repeat domain-containing protein [Eubacteriales bacterium]|nr:leucine-rich repeat domain-containing protein [Eubacteriales bacterium]